MPRQSFEENALLSSVDDVEKAYDAAPLPIRARRSKWLIVSIIVNTVLFGYVIMSHPAINVYLSDTLAAPGAQYIEWRGVKPVYCELSCIIGEFNFFANDLPLTHRSSSAPAQEVITHVTKISGTFTSVSEYSGPPTDAVDKAWSDSYVQCASLVCQLADDNIEQPTCTLQI